MYYIYIKFCICLNILQVQKGSGKGPSTLSVDIAIPVPSQTGTTTQLTVTKKMADARFTRMHCGRKSFQKANWRLLKDRHKRGGYFLCCVKVRCFSFHLCSVVCAWYQQCILVNLHAAIFFIIVNCNYKSVHTNNWKSHFLTACSQTSKAK